MEKFLFDNLWILVIVLFWTLPWKGIALWKSARKGHLGWFFTLLIFNSLAILDILYIYIFSKNAQVEKKEQAVDVRQARMQRLRVNRRDKFLKEEFESISCSDDGQVSSKRLTII